MHHDTIRVWLRAGVIDEPSPRVYRFKGYAATWEDDLLAACMSAHALAAARSALALYQLGPPPKRPELLVVRSRRNLARVTLHSTLDLLAGEATKVGVVPATTPGRSVIGAAAKLRQPAVDDLVDNFLIRRYGHPSTLERRARDLLAPARPGAARVLRALANRHPEIERARNVWEARVLRVLERLGLPTPSVNLEVTSNGRRRFLDVAWQPAFVLLEFDGFLPHLESRKTFDDDRARQNALVDDGWMVFRVTSSMLGRDAARHFEPVARAVSQRWRVDPQDVGHSA
jgi:hypothetical protein